MPPHLSTRERVHAFHADLLRAGAGGHKLPRKEIANLLARRLDLSVYTVRAYIETGRMHGLWDLIRETNGQTSLRINALDQTPNVPDQLVPVVTRIEATDP